jgi:NitT/TauT family transport system substrate-binding protein
MRIGILAALVLGLCALTNSSKAQGAELKFAWTPYPSWQIPPASTLNLDGKGSFLDRRSKETGGKVSVIKFKEYTASITALVAGDMDACAMTLQEALSFCVDGGVPVTVFLVNDYSDGNDVIFGPVGAKIPELATHPVLLEEFSCDEYLLYRCFQMNNLDLGKLSIRATPGDDIPKVFLPHPDQYVVTWNPHVVRIQESGEATQLFSSAQIPGEITDAFVVRTDRIKGREAGIEALVRSYYDFIRYWHTPANAERAIRALANTADFKSDEDVALFKKTIPTTHFYYTPEETVKIMDGQDIRTNVNKVRDALVVFKAFKGANPEKYELSFDSEWVKKAEADGK